MNVERLFNAKPDKFVDVVRKHSGYRSFIEYLASQSNFQVINFMTDSEKKTLYSLACERAFLQD